MSAYQPVLCSACKTEPATTFINGSLEIVGRERYRVKFLYLALCDDCADLADQVTDTGKHLAETLVGANR